jgi:hypothetical protein
MSGNQIDLRPKGDGSFICGAADHVSGRVVSGGAGPKEAVQASGRREYGRHANRGHNPNSDLGQPYTVWIVRPRLLGRAASGC